MTYEIVDNFLDKKEFDQLCNIITDWYFPWYFQSRINGAYEKDEDNSFYLTHVLYADNKLNSDLYNHFLPLINKINPKALVRVKANCYANTPKIEVHKKHIDFPFTHKGCLYSINTCDGATILEDGTKIDSVENRALFFDPSKTHSSTSTTNAKARLNINLNYF